VIKNLTGFGMRKMDPYTSMRFKLGGYAGDMGNARSSFTNDVIHAGKLQDDAALIAQGLSPQNFNTEYEKLQSNNYRILSEVYKDVQALRKLKFTEREIMELIGGRRALSKEDMAMVMNGLFNPEAFENLLKQEKSGLNKSIAQINKELKTFYKVTDFVNPKELADTQKKWTAVPLGLSETERQKYLEMPMGKKHELIIQPAIKELKDLRREQKIIDKERRENLKQEKKAWEENRKSSLPASPFIPEPDFSVTAAMTPNIDQTTGLTRTQTALLSPSEQVIAQRSNKGIMGLV